MAVDPIDLVALLTTLAGGIGYLIARWEARSVRARLKTDIEMLKGVPEGSAAYSDLLALVNAEARALRPSDETAADRVERVLRRIWIVGWVTSLSLETGVRITAAWAGRYSSTYLNVASVVPPILMVTTLAGAMIGPWAVLLGIRKVVPEVAWRWRALTAAVLGLAVSVGVAVTWLIWHIQLPDYS